MKMGHYEFALTDPTWETKLVNAQRSLLRNGVARCALKLPAMAECERTVLSVTLRRMAEEFAREEKTEYIGRIFNTDERLEE